MREEALVAAPPDDLLRIKHGRTSGITRRVKSGLTPSPSGQTVKLYLGCPLGQPAPDFFLDIGQCLIEPASPGKYTPPIVEAAEVDVRASSSRYGVTAVSYATVMDRPAVRLRTLETDP
jgi:hypothetical protein